MIATEIATIAPNQTILTQVDFSMTKPSYTQVRANSEILKSTLDDCVARPHWQMLWTGVRFVGRRGNPTGRSPGRAGGETPDRRLDTS